mgnify:CR=1 FL=1
MKNILLRTFLFFTFTNLQSQDLLAILDNELEKTTHIVSATFKGTRIANGHSIENRKAKELEFIIGHRFERLNSGTYNLFGLDFSNIRFSLEYGITDDLMVGLGRSSFQKLYDGFLKYKLLRQKTGDQSFPFSVSAFASVVSRDYPEFDKRPLTETLFYTSQLLIARKCSSSLSLQITPTYIYRNTIASFEESHGFFALGVGGRVKLSNRVAVNGEYFYNFNKLSSLATKNPIAFGIDIETGGHVFQLILSNAITMVEKSFITETTGNFLKGDIHFGFNISRTF